MNKKITAFVFALLMLPSIAFADVSSEINPIQDEARDTIYKQLGWTEMPKNLSEAGITTGIDWIDGCDLTTGYDPTNYHMANDIDWTIRVVNIVGSGGIPSPFYIFYSETWKVFGYIDAQWDYIVWGEACNA